MPATEAGHARDRGRQCPSSCRDWVVGASLDIRIVLLVPVVG
jgi:hypothetical protein